MSILPYVSMLETHSGKYLISTTNDAINEVLLRKGYFDEGPILISNLVLKSVDGDAVILDIGANMGTYAIPIASGGEDGQKRAVYCFEVQHHVFLQLCGNIFINRRDNIYPLNIAIGNQNGTIDIPAIDYNTCKNTGSFSIDRDVINRSNADFPKGQSGARPCGIRRIDDLDFLPAAHLIKLDVEGYEYEALQGMQNYLKRSGYPPIIFECWNEDWYRQKRELLFDYLASTGYSNISPELEDCNFLAQHVDSQSRRILFWCEDDSLRAGRQDITGFASQASDSESLLCANAPP